MHWWPNESFSKIWKLISPVILRNLLNLLLSAYLEITPHTTQQHTTTKKGAKHWSRSGSIHRPGSRVYLSPSPDETRQMDRLCDEPGELVYVNEQTLMVPGFCTWNKPEREWCLWDRSMSKVGFLGETNGRAKETKKAGRRRCILRRYSVGLRNPSGSGIL